MRKQIIYTSFLLSQININISANTTYIPDSITKEGHCIISSKKKRYEGLKVYKTEEEFISECKGKMIFKYKKNKCRWFTMKDMKFNVLISKENGKKMLFKIGERKKLCTDTVIEEIINK